MAALFPAAPAWWSRSLTRGRVILVADVGCFFVAGTAYGSWTRVCAGTRCPSISRLIGSKGPSQSSKVYSADGRSLAELGLERHTVIKLSDIPPFVRQAFI